jgi:hypothetical protein
MVVNRRLLVLGITLIAAVVALIVVRSGDTPSSTPTRAPRPPVAGRNATQQPAKEATPADVRLSALDRERTEPMDLGRNPFRFKPKPAPPPPAPPPRAQKSPDGSVDGAPPPLVPAGPPPPPPIALKFIGVVQKADGTRIAVLSDGKRPISGKEGEDLEGRYRIMKIGEESIDIAYIDGRGRRTIPLTGK